MPFQAEYTILMHPQMSILYLHGITLIEMAEQYFALLCAKCVVSPLWVDLASLDHGCILIYLCYTFLENKICLDVACQYYRVPYECPAITACLIDELFGLLASATTGEVSWLFNTNCTLSINQLYFFWLGDTIFTNPFEHPAANKVLSLRYYKHSIESS